MTEGMVYLYICIHLNCACRSYPPSLRGEDAEAVMLALALVLMKSPEVVYVKSFKYLIVHM